MKYPWPRDHDDLQPSFETLQADVVEGPVPIVIVKVTEMLCAGVESGPQTPIEGHAHVVLGADPLRYLNLEPAVNDDHQFLKILVALYTHVPNRRLDSKKINTAQTRAF